MASCHAESDRLRIWEKLGLIGFLLVSIAFGVIVELRSAFQQTRKTDLGCYLRAGWAARTGADIYTITDDNAWHFAYPPAFALAMIPLADAPEGQPRDWMLPYALTVGLWYVFSAICIFLAVHWIASALEYRNPTRPGSRLWWYQRMLPIYICLAPIGCTLSRGQVNLLLVSFLAGMYSATVRGFRFRSGVWLALAICLKVIPAFLLVVPLWRRDLRSLLGTFVGLVVGVVILPTLILGYSGALQVHERMIEAVVLPGLAEGTDATRAKELMELTATDNQSIQATLHNYQFPDRATRPPNATQETKIAHVGIGGLLTLGLLLAYGWRPNDDPIRLLMLIGGLIVVMAVISPVSHTHYFCLGVPAVMGLAAVSRQRNPGFLLPSVAMLAFLGLVGILYALPMIPFWEARREAGLPLIACLMLWTANMVTLVASRECVREVNRVKVELPIAA